MTEPGFEDFGLDPNLVNGIRDMGFVRPTPIQVQAIPPALAGRDLLAEAQTGTGKTAAFLLPILHRLMPKPRGKVRALILTPTRELAAQIDEQAAALGFYSSVYAAAVYGGVGMYPQEKAIKAGVDIIVATPGRLLDHIGAGYLSFDALEVLVLDEADRMLDMGFLPDLRRIIQRLPPKHQVMLFSATLPGELMELIRSRLWNPVTIKIGHKMPAAGIRQEVYAVPDKLKPRLLEMLLRRPGMDSVLVFCRTRIRTDRLTRNLSMRGLNVGIIHGNKTQAEREQTLRDFKSGVHRVLIATDVASRGLDVEGISHVINFDVPRSADDYIHRVGRTARAEHEGAAITFFSAEETPAIRAIERRLGKPIPVSTLPGMDVSQPDREDGRGRGRRRRRHFGAPQRSY